jgi:ribosomal-protein-alanine N-acetyltransferase
VACRTEAGNIPELVEEIRKPDPPEKGFAGLISRVRKLFGNNRLPDKEPSARDDEVITGFAGFWVMVDEAHITSIATREAYQRQGIGELMLQSIIDLATGRKARIVTLEVRVSNTVAQGLYTRYGFSQVDLRRGYYTDNREDAIVMSTDSISSAAFRAHVRELKKTYQAKWGTDRYQLAH